MGVGTCTAGRKLVTSFVQQVLSHGKDLDVMCHCQDILIGFFELYNRQVLNIPLSHWWLLTRDQCVGLIMKCYFRAFNSCLASVPAYKIFDRRDVSRCRKTYSGHFKRPTIVSFSSRQVYMGNYIRSSTLPILHWHDKLPKRRLRWRVCGQYPQSQDFNLRLSKNLHSTTVA